MTNLDALLGILRQVLPYEDADLTVPSRGSVLDGPDSMWVEVPGGGPPTRYVRIGTMTVTFDDDGRIVGCGRWIYHPAILKAVGRVNDAVRRGLGPLPDDLGEILPPDLSPEVRAHIVNSVGAPRSKRGTKPFAKKAFAVAMLVNARERGLPEKAACDHVRQVLPLASANVVIHRWRREVEEKFGVESGEWALGDMPYPIGCW